MTTYVSDQIQATAAPTTGEPAPTTSWQWLRNGTPIENAVASLYETTQDDLGADISVQQIARSLGGSASAVSAARGPVLPFDPAALFRNNEQGAWYDVADFDRYMAPLGPELVTNGDFSNGLTGWVDTSGSVWSAVGGQASATSAASDAYLQQSSLVVGKTYRVTANVTVTSGTLRFYSEAGDPVIPTGQLNRIFVADSTFLSFRVFSGSTVTLDNVSVRELTAISTATMFQDSAGTTPVTAVEQPVGLVLDRSKGLTLGPEVVTNGDFSGGATGWSAPASGAAITGGALTFDGVTSIAAGTAITTNTPQVSIVAGKWYLVSYTIVGGTTNPVSVGVGGVTGTARTSAGTYSEYISAVSTTGAQVLTRTAVGVRTGSIDNISVKELPGNHAFQSTAASRPVLSARVNLHTNTGFAGGGAAPTGWSQTIGTGSSAPSGTASNGSTIYTQSATTQRPFFAQSATTVVGVSYRQRLVVTQASGVTYAQIMGVSGLSPSYTNNGVGVSAVDTVQPGEVVATWTAAGTTSDVRYGIGVSGNATGTLSFHSPDLRTTNTGTTLPVYQRVNTATDYDTAGFPLYLAFDGVDDWLQTNNIDFSATDKMTVFAGVRKLSTATGVIAELSASASANNNAFLLAAPLNTGTDDYGFLSKGTVATSARGTGFSPPITNVLTGTADISGDSAVLRVNGTQAASSTSDQGTGNYGNYPLYIGRRGGTTLPFNGRLYSLIVRGATTRASQITQTESWVNQRTRAY